MHSSSALSDIHGHLAGNLYDQCKKHLPSWHTKKKLLVIFQKYKLLFTKKVYEWNNACETKNQLKCTLRFFVTRSTLDKKNSYHRVGKFSLILSIQPLGTSGAPISFFTNQLRSCSEFHFKF